MNKEPKQFSSLYGYQLLTVTMNHFYPGISIIVDPFVNEVVVRHMSGVILAEGHTYDCYMKLKHIKTQEDLIKYVTDNNLIPKENENTIRNT